jgi:acyl-CoA thioester hydrolase
LTKNFVWPVRVYYEDTDAGGVVYYANYLKYFERGRTEYLRSFGFEQDELINNQGIIFAVRAVTIDYIKPARFNQLLHVNTKITAIKKVSLEFNQQINHDNHLLVTGDVRIACLDANTLKPTAIPKNIIGQIEHEH